MIHAFVIRMSPYLIIIFLVFFFFFMLIIKALKMTRRIVWGLSLFTSDVCLYSRWWFYMIAKNSVWKQISRFWKQKGGILIIAFAPLNQRAYFKSIMISKLGIHFMSIKKRRQLVRLYNAIKRLTCSVWQKLWVISKCGDSKSSTIYK